MLVGSTGRSLPSVDRAAAALANIRNDQIEDAVAWSIAELEKAPTSAARAELQAFLSQALHEYPAALVRELTRRSHLPR